MLGKLWRKLIGSDGEPEVIPDLNLLEADAYIGLRSSERQAVQIGVEECYVTPKGEAREAWLPITVVDLSVGGARIVTVDPVMVGDTARMKFKLPHGFGEWCGSGRITWASPTGLLAGMAFDPPRSKKEQDAHGRLVKYVDSTKAPAKVG